MTPLVTRAYAAQRLESYRRDMARKRADALRDILWAAAWLGAAGALAVIGMLG